MRLNVQYADQCGFNEIYMKYHKLVYSVCMSVTRDAEQSRDISQEVFIKLLQWFDRIKDKDKIKSWLCVTAKNMSVDYLRRSKRVYEAQEEVACEDDPESRYIKKERREMIEAAMMRLDGKYTEVLSMKYMLGFSVKEIASASGCNAATVYTRLRRGEAALKRILKEAEL